MITVQAQDYQSSQFVRDKGCYDGYCLANNLSDVLKLYGDVENAIQQKSLIDNERFLESIRSKSISSSELIEKADPFFEYIFHLKNFEPGTFDSEFQEILRSCHVDQARKSNVAIVNERHILIAKTLCMKENFQFNILELENNCDHVLKDTFELIDLTSEYPGSFSQVYVNNLLEDKKFDNYIVEFNKEIEKILGKNWKSQIQELDRTRPELLPEKIRNLDLGALAIKVTGSNEMAIRLVQVLISDPGARVIKEKFREKLRRDDLERFKKIRNELSDDNINSLIELSGLTKNVFGMDFKRNWSNRNYKAIAGVTLGYELGKRGHSKELSTWASQFIGEAYKIKSHILPAMSSGKSIKGDHPYFVIDSAAHYTGAELGHQVSQGKGFSKQEMESAIKIGTDRSEGHWKQIEKLKYFLD